MKINIKEKIFDLNKTLYSGKTHQFFFYKKNKAHYGFLREKSKYRPIKIKQKKGKLKIKTKATNEKIREFLGLNDELKKIYEKINTDKTLEKSINQNKGLRITKTNPLLTILIFISSSNNSMRNIKNFLNILRKRFGKKAELDNKEFYLPPSPKKLFNLEEKDFRECKAGYRAEYMEKSFDFLKDNYNRLNEFNKMEHHEIKEELKKLHGVGEKVADCISLFAYKNLEAFPIDTHIRSLMKKKYLNEKASDGAIKEFARDNWGEYAGYAQQYLYKQKTS